MKIIVAENQSALVIPAGALRTDVETGSAFVFTVDGGKARSVEVRTGIVTRDSVEIVSGLSEGDVVIIGGARVADGMDIEVSAGKGGRK